PGNSGRTPNHLLMRLELASYPVAEVAVGAATRLDGGRLTVRVEDVREAVAHPAIAEVSVEVVRPGEPARITQISDVVEPRISPEGRADVFPGLVGAVEAVGSGRTNRLTNMSVMVTGEVPWLGAGGLFVPRDNFLDIGGPGAELSPYSRLWNLV